MRRLKQKRTYEVALGCFGAVAGVDEAGRGACAGPISIAACVLPPRIVPELDRLADSKKLSAKVREELAPIIKKVAVAWSIVHIEAAEIDHNGIQWANVCGMRRAVANLEIQPGYVVTDALKVPGLSVPHLPIIGGDDAARCISAASVLAKTARDQIMRELGEQYPEYGFADHKGYGTRVHMDAVRRHGASPQHRYTYANVAAAHREWLSRGS